MDTSTGRLKPKHFKKMFNWELIALNDNTPEVLAEIHKLFEALEGQAKRIIEGAKKVSSANGSGKLSSVLKQKVEDEITEKIARVFHDNLNDQQVLEIKDHFEHWLRKLPYKRGAIRAAPWTPRDGYEEGTHYQQGRERV